MNSCSTIIEINLINIPMHFCISITVALLICCFICNINNPLRNDHDEDQKHISSCLIRVRLFTNPASLPSGLASHSTNKRSFILSLLSTIRMPKCCTIIFYDNCMTRTHQRDSRPIMIMARHRQKQPRERKRESSSEKCGRWIPPWKTVRG